jgi:hypothetical protein
MYPLPSRSEAYAYITDISGPKVKQLKRYLPIVRVNNLQIVRKNLGVVFGQIDLSLFGLLPFTFQRHAEEKRPVGNEVLMDMEFLRLLLPSHHYNDDSEAEPEKSSQLM